MNYIRFRQAVKEGVYGALLSPVGALLGLWVVEKFAKHGTTGEEALIIGGVVLSNSLGLWLRKAVMPLRRSADLGTTPPVNAEFLFYLFLDAQKCDALVGDLEERYRLIHKKFGQGRASFWYWAQAIRSVGPIVWAATRAVVKRLSGLAALVELYKRIRQ